MLSALVLAAVVLWQSPSGQRPAAPDSGLATLFAQAGYPLTIGPRGIDDVTIKIERATVKVRLLGASLPEGYTVLVEWPNIGFVIEIPVVHDLPLGEKRIGRSSDPKAATLLATPHLGGTVELREEIPLDGKTTPSVVRKAIRQFFEHGIAYAEEHDGEFVATPETDWSRVRFTDAQPIDAVDEVSLSRLLASWGMKELKPTDKESEIRGKCVSVGGTRVFIGIGNANGDLSTRTYRLAALVSPPKDEDPFTWAVGQGHAMTWLTVLASAHGASVFRQDIEPAKGLTVGSLRNKILNFAATMRSIDSLQNGG